ncbi:MAG: hypothetical protein IPN77_20200 [Sandaracinaceae bacterium]|nr:hypothetical protein [Sandaracinaceae bacterium]
MEIGSHAVRHAHGLHFDEATWRAELADHQRISDLLSLPRPLGFRAPFLQYNGRPCTPHWRRTAALRRSLAPGCTWPTRHARAASGCSASRAWWCRWASRALLRRQPARASPAAAGARERQDGGGTRSATSTTSTTRLAWPSSKTRYQRRARALLDQRSRQLSRGHPAPDAPCVRPAGRALRHVQRGRSVPEAHPELAGR